MKINVDGVVLAAGQSKRMGVSKAQLEFEPGVTLLEHAVQILRKAGCRYIVAVVNVGDDWTARLADVAGAAVVINDRPNSQQIDSIRLGIVHLPDDAAGAMVLPVDFPALRVGTVTSMINAFEHRQPPVLVPICLGRPGHPVIFSREIFGELMTDPLPRGAETVVDAHRPDRFELRIDDPGILLDVDSPADYQSFLRGR
ncbi:MAG: nucleotidyltransferase family protein [Gemmatimonadota bacterium]